jgi:hypothetical protein
MSENKSYLILRGIENSSRILHPLPEEAKGRKIDRVWLLLDEVNFTANGGVAAHHVNAFLDDRLHDWEQRGEALRYYAHSSAPGDKVDLVVYFEPEPKQKPRGARKPR